MISNSISVAEVSSRIDNKFDLMYSCNNMTVFVIVVSFNVVGLVCAFAQAW
jgi:hypothetical protein